MSRLAMFKIRIPRTLEDDPSRNIRNDEGRESLNERKPAKGMSEHTGSLGAVYDIVPS